MTIPRTRTPDMARSRISNALSNSGMPRGVASASGRVEPRERADHEDVAMREVDEAQNAVDHRITERDQGIDRPRDRPLMSCWRNSIRTRWGATC